MSLQDVYDHPTVHEQKCPLSSMQVSHPRTQTQKDIDQQSHGRCNSNEITGLTLRGQSCLLSDPAFCLHKLVTNAAAATANGR